MAAIADLSDLVNRMTGGNSGSPETIFFHKVPRILGVAATAPIVGRRASMWRYDGMPAAGDIPTSAEVPTRSTTGAIPFTAPGGDRQKWLLSAGITPLSAGLYLLYDRLFHVGGFTSAVSGDHTIQGDPPSPALTRNTGGTGNFAFYEIHTILGTTGRNLTMTYTNQNGTSGKTATINIGATGFREVTRAQQIPLAAGDTGIRAIEKINLDASTGSAGNFSIVIGRPIAWIPVGGAGSPGWRDWTTGLPGIPEINSNACLALAYIPVVATATEISGMMGFVES
jgi:hypothetical protein